MHRFWRCGGAQAKPATGLFEKNGNLFSSLLMKKGPFCPPASRRRTASYPSPLNNGNRCRLGWSTSFLHNLIACSIDEGKIGLEKGGGEGLAPAQSPLVFLFRLAACDLTCSPLSKRLEQANNLNAQTWGQKQQDKNERFELIYLWYK